ncbi:TATA box-binding protein-like protein 1 [Pecten maximus]|uniref:TATA box-binding protein-like protein 1 n=1 Tax=Pecten maximus TaxID=6579 RepID=UPI001458F9C0|nr:TATA box-binding protein-like protein 1 [Pecten maximus]
MAESQHAAALLVVGEDGSVNGTNGEALSAALNDHTNQHDTNENCAQENGEDDGPTIDIIINNVVASYSTRCHLDLRRIAMDGKHVEYKREYGMCNMKIRRPYTTATIWSSGKITCTGATSEEASKIAARRFARQLQRMGFKVKFSNFRVVNVLGTCILPFKIKITSFSRKHSEHASYEPELHPGVTYKIKEPKATLKIFSTGSITVTAPCVANVQSAIEHIFPLVLEFRADDEDIDKSLLENEARFIRKQRGIVKPKRPVMNYEEYEDFNSDDSEGSFDSDESQD